ncbi:PTS sugar transporter subunit IIA [uncultured Cetobacterium sp.]|uniref:PTS sugar transporter subunit IIA n=1 Tax=uncultured Cetobacterium sp. TaxID=527638 RepID=UPI002625E678|nr:PTS sugar transporter subunit IIA [uncultured Cetobacterium sp.]
MKEILEGNICVVDRVNSWRDGVERAGNILLFKNKIEKKYIEAAIKNIEKLGNYIILTDGVAMPHARPEDGALETAVSLLVIKEGVVFSGEEERVKLIFMLASKDNSSHINILRKLSNLIDDDEMIGKLSNSSNEVEILNFL